MRLRETGAPQLIRALSPRASLIKIRDGRHYVIKPIHQQWNGRRVVNVEAEWVAWQLFRRAGVRSPAVTVIEWPGAPGPQLGSRYQPHARPVSGRSDRLLSRIDAEALCRLLIVDAIIGNVDRHLTNVLVDRPTRGSRSCPVAIDHGLSMVTESVTHATPLVQNFTAGIDGQPVTGRTTRWETLVAREQGTLRRLWRCQPLVEIAATLGPKGIGAQTELVRQLISERVISAIVRAMPDDIIHERPARARKDELTDVLLSRRTAIHPRAVVAHFNDQARLSQHATQSTPVAARPDSRRP